MHFLKMFYRSLILMHPLTELLDRQINFVNIIATAQDNYICFIALLIRMPYQQTPKLPGFFSC